MDIDAEARAEKFKSDLESDLAKVESEYDALKLSLDKLGRERDALRQLIEETDRFLSSIRGDNVFPQEVSRTPRLDSTSAQESTPTTNGLPEDASRREKILHIVPSFHGKPFKTGDIRQKYVEVYLGGVEPPNFPQAINNLLKRMAKKGEIKSLGRDENQLGAPYIYQENVNQEETLLQSEP